VILFGLYAPDLGRTKGVCALWYRDCSLLFTREEMRSFLRECKTASGKPDSKFGFGFDKVSGIHPNRGKMKLLRRNLANHRLERSYIALKEK
jgi:hypothetical protein